MLSVEDSHYETVMGLMQGAYDTHIHSGPDVVPRRADALELARDAASAGMGGIVLKCHVASTEGQAYLTQQAVPGLRVCGGLALNYQCGGLNPAAVELALRLGARIIWMPTVYADNHKRHEQASSHIAAIGGGIGGDGITVWDDGRRLLPQVLEILSLVAQRDAVLATGHISPAESMALVTGARRQGVKRIVVTHPELQMTRMSWQDQDELAGEGVFFERCWVVTTPSVGEGQITPWELAAAIGHIGAASTIMATDHGQAANPRPVEAMRDYIHAMLEAGLSERDVETMVRKNPSSLLDP